MRNCFRIGVLLLPGVLILLDGCSQAEPEHHTVSWYADHDQERGVKLTWCADDAARKATDDCRNAAAAMAGAQSNGRRRSATPCGLTISALRRASRRVWASPPILTTARRRKR